MNSHFLLNDGVGRLDIGEDGGLDEEALLAVTLTAGNNLGATVLALLDVVHDTVELLLGDLRALEGSSLEGV